MKNQCSFNIILRKELVSKKSGLAPLALQAFINGKRLVLSLNLYIPLDAWDNTSRKITSKDLQDHQYLIDKAKAKANDIIIEHRLRDVFLSVESFKEKFTSSGNKNSFTEFYSQELEKRYARQIIKHSSYKNCKITLNKLTDFKADVTFNEINSEFIEKFDAWNRNNIKRRLIKSNRKPVKNSLGARHKDLKNIRAFLNIAKIKLGINIPNPFTTIKVKEPINHDRVFLEIDEVQALDQVFDSGVINDYHKATLAKFLFACFTSIRVGDVHNLMEMRLINNRIIFTPQKTSGQGKEVTIPLNQSALKYYNYIKAAKLTSTSDQKINLALKKLAIIAGINKRVTFHTARHTFAAQFIATGGDVVVLQSILGHSDIRTTMVYVHLGRGLKDSQINKMDKILS